MADLPEDIEILVQCHLYRKFPEEYDAVHLAEKLADFIIRTVKPRRLKPDEIAMMVDPRAISHEGVIARAAEAVADLLGPTYSLDLIKTYQNRGGGLGSKKLREAYRQDLEQLKRIEAGLSDADREALRRSGEQIAAILKPHVERISRFRGEKNDIISRSVIEDE